MTRKVKQPGRGYAGLEKIKLYHYDANGNFLKTYNSCAELREEHFPVEPGKRPLFNNKRWELFKYDILPDNSFYSDFRIGRDRLFKNERIFNSKLCVNNSTDNIPVEAYNLQHEKIGEFKSVYIAHLLTKINQATINRSAKNGKGKGFDEIYFKYKL